jgi:glucose/arabinose dehydrogenase
MALAIALLCLPDLFSFGATLPAGFVETRIATGLDPTSMQIAPDGRIFITIKSGKVLIYKNNTLLTTPFLSINVDNFDERGLQSIAFDPDFTTNHYVYIYYAVPGGNHNRVSRFTANGDLVVSGSELILLNLEPMPGTLHNGGSLFFKDGKLFVTTGDGGGVGYAQSKTSLLGKVLRINSNGTIPADNPLNSSTTGVYKAIYAMGFRNPFKTAIQPGTGRVFINDVGQSTWEEINDLLPGKNYGWPTIEGKRTTQTAPADYMDPLYAYAHTQGCAATGAAFYNPTTNQFPARYSGKYLFGDYCNGSIKVLDPVTGTVTETFASAINRPIDIKIAPDGSLYYLARGGLGGATREDNTSSSNGEIWKVQYTGSGVPTISAQPANVSASVGTSATFIVGASGNNPLSYQWQRNGQDIAGATSSSYTINSVVLTDNGAVFRVRVSNSIGNVLSNGATLTVNSNQLPVPTISTPLTGSKYSGGQVISFSGNGTDTEDGTLPASAFTWKIDFHHDTHVHPALGATTGIKSGTYSVPVVGETSSNVWYRIYLTVTDSKGQSKTIYRDVLPNVVSVTLTTNPAGLQLKLDGSIVLAPYTFSGVTGITRSIEAPTPQTLNGTSYSFASWSDGVGAVHSINTPATSTSYIATFSSGSATLRTPENPTNTIAGLDYKYYHGTWSAVPVFSSLAPVKTGTVSTFDLGPRSQSDNFGFAFSGYINVPTDGVYTFYSSSDDGSQLKIGNTLIVNNDGLHGDSEKSGSIGLKAGKHAISLSYFERTGFEVLKVSYSGPGITKTIIPAGVLFRVGSGTSTNLVLETENAYLYYVAADTYYSGYSGTGYGDYSTRVGSYIQWTANVPTAGSYTLRFRYALGVGTDRPLQIMVNGIVVATALSMPNTANSWTNWQTVSLISSLRSGNNTIRATEAGLSGPNVDRLEISNAAATLMTREDASAECTDDIVLYPSPANESLRIIASEDIDLVKVNNSQGNVMNVTYRKDGKQLTLDLRSLSPGLYIIGIAVGNELKWRKVLIER